MTPMMQCGHAANGTHDGKPCCVICFGIHQGATIEDKNPPSLEGRKAICICDKTVPSSPELAFFQHLPDRSFDIYYCGCAGWD